MASGQSGLSVAISESSQYLDKHLSLEVLQNLLSRAQPHFLVRQDALQQIDNEITWRRQWPRLVRRRSSNSLSAWKLQGRPVRDDALFSPLSILAVERSTTPEAFVQDDADTPPVATAIVRLALDDLSQDVRLMSLYISDRLSYLWRHVLAGTNYTPSHLPTLCAIAPVQETFTPCTLIRI